MSADTLRILREASALLTPPGNWCQDKAMRGAACCLLQALQSVPSANNGRAYMRAYRAVAYLTTGDSSVGSIVTWNDAPGRTHAEVLDALDRAIAHAEAGP